MTPTKIKCSCCREALLLQLSDMDITVCVKCDQLARWPDRQDGR